MLRKASAPRAERSGPAARPSGDRAVPGLLESLVSAANGVVGDHLRRSRNALAIPLGIYHDNARVDPTRAAVRDAYPRATDRLCVLVHGLGCHEGVWRFEQGDASYGSLLARDHRFTPVFIRYNSGLPVSVNGRALASTLSRLWRAYPAHVREIVCIGHSMGGLVLRSACHDALRRRHAWVRRVTKVFYLGTPHDGADLERATHAAETVLRRAPSAVSGLISEILASRSQGIKDLRSGDFLDRDVAADVAAGEPGGGGRSRWLTTARHYLVTGTLHPDPQHLMSLVLGDGLVRDGSRRRPPASTRASTHTRTFPGIGHVALAHHPDVYAQIRRWCEEP